jgi:hypothetical protein
MARRDALQLKEAKKASQCGARTALPAIADTMLQTVNVRMNARWRNLGIVDASLPEARRQELP